MAKEKLFYIDDWSETISTCLSYTFKTEDDANGVIQNIPYVNKRSNVARQKEYGIPNYNSVCVEAKSKAEAKRLLQAKRFQAIIDSLKMPGHHIFEVEKNNFMILSQSRSDTIYIQYRKIFELLKDMDIPGVVKVDVSMSWCKRLLLIPEKIFPKMSVYVQNEGYSYEASYYTQISYSEPNGIKEVLYSGWVPVVKVTEIDKSKAIADLKFGALQKYFRDTERQITRAEARLQAVKEQHEKAKAMIDNLSEEEAKAYQIYTLLNP